MANEHWRAICQKLPGGLWLVGANARAVMTAALIDAAAYRAHDRLEGPGDGCLECPTPGDLEAAAQMGIDPPGPCRDHQLDQDAADAYRELHDLIGVRDVELARLERAIRAVERDR